MQLFLQREHDKTTAFTERKRMKKRKETVCICAMAAALAFGGTAVVQAGEGAQTEETQMDSAAQTKETQEEEARMNSASEMAEQQVDGAEQADEAQTNGMSELEEAQTEWIPVGKPAASQIFTVAMECDHSPYNWKVDAAENGAVPVHFEDISVFGYDVLVAQKICETYGWQLEILKFNQDALIPAVVSGTVDCVISAQTVTEEQMSYVDVTEPYYTSKIVVLTQKNGDYAEAAGLSELSGASCSSQNGTFWQDSCLMEIPDAKIKEGEDDVEDLLEELVNGEYDLIVTDEPTALAACAKYPELKLLDFSNTEDAFTPSEENQLVITVKKGNTKLRDEINEVLEMMDQEARTELMNQAIAAQQEEKEKQE